MMLSKYITFNLVRSRKKRKRGRGKGLYSWLLVCGGIGRVLAFVNSSAVAVDRKREAMNVLSILYSLFTLTKLFIVLRMPNQYSICITQ